MKRRETVVYVSHDGKRAVGKSFVVDDGNEEPVKGAPEMEEELKALDQRLQGMINNYAGDCDKDAREAQKEIERHSDRAERLYAKVKRFTAKSEYLQKKINFWKQTGTIAVFTLSILGFIAGVFISISEWLKFHGPTKSITDTAIAFLIYCVSGLILCAVIGWLTKVAANRRIRHYKELFERNEELLTEFISEKKISTQEVEKYCKMRDDKSRKARQIRGLL